MKGNIKRYIVLLICVLICLPMMGCKNNKPQDENEVIDMLKSINNYSSDVEINIINNKEKITISGQQDYCKGKVCKLKLNNSREIVYKNKNIYVNDVENKKKYDIDEDFDDVYKLSFMDEYIKLIYSNEKIKYRYKNVGNIEYMVIILDLPYMNRNLNKAELYIDYQNRSPYKVIIYNNNNIAKVNIEYKNFKNR